MSISATETQKLKADWMIEECSDLLDTLDQQIARLTSDRNAARAKKTELTIESRRLACAIFEEEHGVCPKELISDYMTQVYMSVTHLVKLGLPRAVKWCELVNIGHSSLSFISLDAWEKCKMTPLEVQAAKVLGRYREVTGVPNFESH